MIVEQLVADALNCITSDEHSEACIWVGFSVGVDSTTLLHSAAQYSALFNKRLSVIHVHHGLSKHADAWAWQAQEVCEQFSQKFSITINCIIERVQLNTCGEGLEQAARAARYDVFAKYCQPTDVLLQGHHLDDQIETFFMRAIRGSGVTGLSGIPKQRNLSRSNTCQILRPFLAIEKKKLVEYATAHNLSWVEDESNQDSDIDRNWWRNELLPKIWQRYPKHKQSMSRTINNVQHEQALLQALILDRLMQHADESHNDLIIHPALNRIPRFNLSCIEALDQTTSVSYLRAWLAQYVDILPSAIQMQAIYAEMIHAGEDREPEMHWGNSCLYRYQGSLYLVVAVNNNAIDIVIDTAIDWQGESLRCFGGQLECIEIIGAVSLKPAPYNIRCWKPGDVAKPFGRSTRKMKKWWQDYHVPSWARQCWPIIVNKKTDEVVAVPGLFVCEGYCTEQEKQGWSISFTMRPLD